jgi:hypothetical protein
MNCTLQYINICQLTSSISHWFREKLGLTAIKFKSKTITDRGNLMEYYHCLITHSDGYFAKQTNCMKHNKLHIWVFTTFVRVSLETSEISRKSVVLICYMVFIFATYSSE